MLQKSFPYIEYSESQNKPEFMACYIDLNCISHSTNTLGKGMNPIIFSPAMGK